jgi:hypothetical protein
LGIGDDVQNIIFRILAAILTLGELQFEKFTNEKKEEGSKIKNMDCKLPTLLSPFLPLSPSLPLSFSPSPLSILSLNAALFAHFLFSTR